MKNRQRIRHNFVLHLYIAGTVELVLYISIKKKQLIQGAFHNHNYIA